MKKLIALTLILLLALFSFAACSPDDDPDDTPSDAGNTDTPALPEGSDNAMPDLDWDLLS